MARGPDLSGVLLDGRYQVIERMAEGAMGVVYRGLRTQLGRQVAIKVMHAALPEAMAARGRFEREAKLMALLEHPHCVSVIDYGLHGDNPYVVMELVRGRSLQDVIAEQGRFELPRAVDIVRQVLSGLAHAHEQGIIHRDIKPANIMITPKAPLGVHARILDFGLARLYASSTSLTDGLAVGTPSYMAPEQCRGDQVDERADLYACGVVLYELVTGRKPFVAPDPIAVIKQQLDKPAPRLSDAAPGDYGALEDVIARALAKQPADRFRSATAMSEAIDAAVAGRPAADKTASFSGRDADSSVEVPITGASTVLRPTASEARTVVHAPRSSRRWWLAFACVALLGAAGYASYVMFFMDEAPAPAPARAAVPQVVRDAAPVAIAADAPEHATAAAVAYQAGLGYFAKLWWTDGIKSFRRAIELDPSYRDDETLLRTAARAFATTPGYDDRLGSFLVWLGPPARPYVDELARTHGNPEVRTRCASLARRLEH